MNPTILIIFNQEYVVLYCITNNNLYPFFVEPSVYDDIVKICHTQPDIHDIKEILVYYNESLKDLNFCLMREIELIGYITGVEINETAKD